MNAEGDIMREVLLQGWIIQIVFVLIVQVLVLTNINKINIGRFVLMTGIYMVPVVGIVFVLLVAAQAMRSVPDSWGQHISVFEHLAQGYED